MTRDQNGSQHIEFTIDAGIARLIFRRPEKRNAFTAEMWTAVVAELQPAAAADDVRCLVVTGSGGSFSAGADLSAVRDSTGGESLDYRRMALAGIAAIREFPRPTVALVDGACVGAGCSIALACDVRFATPAASFAVPAVRYGILFEEWGVSRLVELIGSGQTSRFLFSAVKLSGTEAARIGLIEECVDDLAAAAQPFLALTGQADPSIVSGTRDLIHRFAGITPPRGRKEP